MFKLKPRSAKTRKNKKTQSSKLAPETSPNQRQESLAQKRRAKEARNKLISLVTFSLFFAVLFGVPLALAVDVKTGILISLGIPCLILGYNYPRQAIWLFLIYLPFNGTVTYWIGGGNALFQLSKDVFYIPALIGLVQECRRKRKPILIPKKLMPTLGFLLFSALLTLLIVNGMKQFSLPACSSLSDYEKVLRDAAGNFILDQRGIVIKTPCLEGTPFMQGLLGLKVLMGYIPLIFCAYYLIEDKKKLLFLGRLLVTLAIICCVLGLAQYWMLKTGRCAGTEGIAEEFGLSGDALFKTNILAKCLVGGSVLYAPTYGVIRLPGTFVSPWHWSWFLVSNAAFSFATAFSDTSRVWRGAGIVSMVLLFINGIICGQRLAFALVPVIIVVLLILTGQFANLKRFIPLGIGLVILSVVALSFFNPDFIQQRVDSFVGRWNQSPPQAFIQNQIDFALRNQGGLLGKGLGTATNSARAFGPVSLIETFHPKLFYEVGLLGFIAFMVFITHLTLLTYKAYRSVRDKAIRSFASSFWVFVLIIGYFPYWYPLDTDPVAVYYWLIAGVIFKLPEIDKQEREKIASLEESESGDLPKKFKFGRKRLSAV
jgi:hypothetical protein